jgi:transcriptional regulator with XRE-family HTH domain
MVPTVGRPEQPIEGCGPLADFARDLRAARIRAGLTYRRMAEITYFSIAVLSCAANGKTAPTWAVTQAYLRACGIDQSLEDTWRGRWSAVHRAVTRRGYGSP